MERLSLTGTGKWFIVAGNMPAHWFAFVWASYRTCTSPMVLSHLILVWMYMIVCALCDEHPKRWNRHLRNGWIVLIFTPGSKQCFILVKLFFHGIILARITLVLTQLGSETKDIWCLLHWITHFSAVTHLCFSSLTIFMALSVSSSAFSRPVALFVCFCSLLRSAHFSRTPFPSGCQATKYSNWCRQLGFITNGKRSRAAANEHERRGEFWLFRQLNSKNKKKNVNIHLMQSDKWTL